MYIKTSTEKQITLTSEVEKVPLELIFFIIPFGINYRNENNVGHVAEIISTKKKANEFGFKLDKR